MERKSELKVKCPVCGNLSFEEEDDFDICPVCNWENDGTERYAPDMAGANKVSYNEACKMWEKDRTQIP